MRENIGMFIWKILKNKSFTKMAKEMGLEKEFNDRKIKSEMDSGSRVQEFCDMLTEHGYGEYGEGFLIYCFKSIYTVQFIIKINC